ncbi:MAG: class I SAM-dependent DNA methyltransferase [Gemmatimonadaceae bacterium]
MNGLNCGESISAGGTKFYKKDFWGEENLKYRQPHFRLEKSARIISRLAQGKERTVLDVGCGPAALMHLLPANITYYGIDISIPDPAPNLREADFVETPIGFGQRRFDIIVAQGVFEYLGALQAQKFAEIAALLKKGGVFIVSYVNFGHREREVYWPYNNVQSIEHFRQDLARVFCIASCFPTSHNWNHSEPRRRLVRAINLHMNVNIPIISPALAVEYFFICSPRRQ